MIPINTIITKLKDLNYISRVTPPPIEVNESNNNAVYIVENTVIKIHNKEESRLQFENKVLGNLTELSIVPKVQFFESLSVDWKSYEVLWMELIHGSSLQHYWKNYSSDVKLDVVTKIISGLKQIHTLDQKHFGKIGNGFGDPKSYLGFLTEKFAMDYEKAMKNHFIEWWELRNLSEVFYKNSWIFNSEKSVFVHNDIWYKNILANPLGFIAIIDFESAIFAPKQIELFRLLHHKFSARQYLESGSQDYTEMEFLDLLLSQIELQYPELKDSFQEKEFFIYNLSYYISLLSKYQNSWYNHEEVVKFRKIFIDDFMP